MKKPELTQKELEEIENGARRWHSVNTETALKLVHEIRRLREKLTLALLRGHEESMRKKEEEG